MSTVLAKTAVWLGTLLVVSLVLYFALAGRNAGQKAVFVEDITLAEALEQAEATDRPVFVLALATWCPHCQALDKEGLADSGVQAAIDELVIPVRYNISARRIDPDAWPEIDRLRVTEVPTMLLLDASGREIGRLTGVIEAAALEAWIRSAGQEQPADTGSKSGLRSRG